LFQSKSQNDKKKKDGKMKEAKGSSWNGKIKKQEHSLVFYFLFPFRGEMAIFKRVLQELWLL
jgi:hypothetical protein